MDEIRVPPLSSVRVNASSPEVELMIVPELTTQSYLVALPSKYVAFVRMRDVSANVCC